MTLAWTVASLSEHLDRYRSQGVEILVYAAADGPLDFRRNGDDWDGWIEVCIRGCATVLLFSPTCPIETIDDTVSCYVKQVPGCVAYP